ncbi:MAG: family 10 glycosylhydrolase [Bacteroidales bacterium]|nr:family 10 glycosylhydrolase [Bacteroidales bacterium]
MNILFRYFCFLLCIFSLNIVRANTDAGEPMREFRAVWLTSVWNIDWPHSTSVSAQAQKNRLVTMLNTLQATNINAVLFQVRPNADALYQSAYEPWSQWITGTRGQAPGYDPLAFLIQEAHKRGIEVHAWLNPYRFENTAGQYSGMPGDYSQTHPELIFTHNNRTFFDPGRPGTTQLIKSIIADLVENYDLSGIVFDDYFYPSGIPLSADQETFDSFTTEALEALILPYYPTITRGNFRRASVNNMIKEVHDTIKAIDPHMIFGVSPAGIYSMQASAAANWGTTLPQGIIGADNWATIFCDPLAWLHDGSVDYLSPQLYWPIGGNQDYLTLVEWWGQECESKGRHAYPSIGTYRLPTGLKNESDINALYPMQDEYLRKKLSYKLGDYRAEKIEYTLEEIENQILANRNNTGNNVFGSIFYSTRDLTSRVPSLAPFLADGVYAQKAVPQLLDWMVPVAPGAPEISEIAATAIDPELAAISIINSPARQFLVYGWEEPPSGQNKNNPGYMQMVFGKNMALFYPENKNYFAVSELLPNKQIGNFSEPAAWEYLAPPTIISPDNTQICHGELFTWTAVNNSDGYQVVIANHEQQDSIVFTSPMLEDNNFSLESGLIEGQQDYLFRIRAMAGAAVSYSLPGYFSTGYPSKTHLITPADGEEEVDMNAFFEWSAVPGAQHYHLQVATDDSFGDTYLVIDAQEINDPSYSATLEAFGNEHFARVRALNNCGFSTWSPITAFTTVYPEVIPGDANCDGVINILDVITIVTFYLGSLPDPFCFENADVNGDGIINVIDVIGTVELF